MKSHTRYVSTNPGVLLPRICLFAFGLLAAVAIVPASWAAAISKETTGTDLTAGASWMGGVAPAASDLATWDTGSLGAGLSLNSGTPSWLGLKVSAGASDPISIGSGGTLTLGTSGIDMSAATINATISSGLTLGAGSQVWNVATGRTLTHNTGTFTRSAGASLLVDKSVNTGTVTAGPTLVNSVVPWAVVRSSGTAANNSANGHTFPTVSGGNIVPYTTATAVTTSYPASAATVNYDWSSTGTLALIGSSRAANTIRFTGTAAVVQQVNSTQTETFGALMNAGGGTVTLGGGAQIMNIQSPAGELVLAAMTSGIIINGPIINNGATAGAVTIAGPNTVTLGGLGNFTGNVNVNSGTLVANLSRNAVNPTTGALGNPQNSSRSIIVNNGGTLRFATGDTLGGANSSIQSTLVVNQGGIVTNTTGVFNTLGPVQLNGGTINGAGGAVAGYQMFNLRGNVTVGGSSMSTIAGSGSFAGYHLAAPTTFNVADATNGTDLLVSGSLTNRNATDGGLGSLTKTGVGTMTLSGVNTYGGATTISAGTLALSGSGSLASTVISVGSSGTFDVSGVSFTLASGQSLTNGTGTVNGSVATAAGSSIYPATAGTAGTLTFNNNLNMSAGGTASFDVSTTAASGNDQIVVGGNLTLSSSDTIRISALGGAANLDTTADYILFAVSGTTTVGSQPVLVWDGATPANYLQYAVTTSGNNVVLRYSSATAPTVTAVADPASVARNQPVVITAIVTAGSGSIASVNVDASSIGGSPTTSLVLSNNFIYTNTVVVSSATTTGAKSLLVAVTDDTSPTPLSGSYNLALPVAAGNKTWDGGSPANDNWTSNPNWTSDIAPALSGDSVTFAGTTRLTPSLDANHSVTGIAFDATAGSFNLGAAGGALTMTTGSGIVNNSANPQTFSLPVALNNSQTVNAASGDITLSGSLTGAGGLTKTGNGTLTLSAENTFGGSLFGKSGTVVIGTGGKVNTGGSYCSIGVATGDNATLTLSGTGTFTNSNDFNLGDINDSIGTLNLQDSAVIQLPRFFIGSANASGSTAQGTVNQTGGTLIQTDGGIGTFSVGGRTSTLGVGIYNMSGGTLTAVGGIRVGGTGTGTFNVSGSAVINANGGFNISRNTGTTGTLNLNGGTVTTLNITSSTGVNCTNNFNGATVKPTTANTWISGLARANVRNGGAILDTAGINVTVSQALLHSDIIGDNATDGGLTKKGAGTLTLTGASSYTGTTTVSNGTLRVNGSIAGGTVTVAPGATLDGTGTVNAPIDVQSGGTLAAGNSIGTLTVNGASTLAGTVVAEVTNGPSSDLINFTGGATLGGTLTVVANGTLTSGQTFNLFEGALSGTFTTLNLPGGPGHWNTSALYTLGEITFANAAPNASNFDVGVVVGGSTTATVVGKFATDADGDAVTITAVSTPASGTATIVAGTNITYVNTSAAATDSFTYTVGDGLGGTDTKTVTVIISSPEGFNLLSGPVNNGNGTLTISYLGIPGANYSLDTTSSLTPPITWTPVATQAAAANGALSFTFPIGDSQGFFRTRHVP